MVYHQHPKALRMH